jgi:hypothetical protein
MDGLVSTDIEEVFSMLNLIFTVIFTVEMTIKLYGFGLKGYCNDYFNIFDGIVVLLSLVEITIEQVAAQSSSSETTTVDATATAA